MDSSKIKNLQIHSLSKYSLLAELYLGGELKDDLSCFSVYSEFQAVVMISCFYLKEVGYDMVPYLKCAFFMLGNSIEKDGFRDMALEIIYPLDKYFVVKILRSKLKKSILFLSDRLSFALNNIDPGPLTELVEYEIDNNNPRVLEFPGTIFRQVFQSSSQLVEYLRRWPMEDKKREKIKLKVVKMALRLPFNKDDDSDGLIELVKEVAERYGINFEQEMSKVNDNRSVQAQAVIKKILRPDRKVDNKSIDRFIEQCPEMVKALSVDWLREESVLTWSRKTVFEQIYLSRSYWEKIFKVINQYCAHPNNHDLRNKIRKGQKSALAEAEIYYFLDQKYEHVHLEKQGEDGGELDFSIENGRYFIEHLEVQEAARHLIEEGGVGDGGSRIFNKLMDKLEQAAEASKKYPGKPIVLCVHAESFFDDVFAFENVIYSKLKFNWVKDSSTHETIDEYSSRDGGNIFDQVNSEKVSAIIFYKRDLARGVVVGTIYENINAQDRLHPGDVVRLRGIFEPNESLLG